MEEVKSKSSKCKRRVQDLPPAILKKLSLHLNPRMVCGNDWKNLAGAFGCTYIEIRNYEQEKDPTMEVLFAWWSEAGDRTVSSLMDIIRKLKRADVLEILEPYEFYDGVSDQSQPTGEEYTEIDVGCNAASKPSTLPLVVGLPNGTHRYDLDSFDTESNFSFTAKKCEPSEHNFDSSAYPTGREAPVDTDSQEELDNTPGEFHGRGSRTNASRADMSVQTQVPSPTVGYEAPTFPSPAAQERMGVMDIGPLTAPHDKIALVIGNLNYKKEQFDKLSYTMNDAYDIAAALVDLQFKVISMVNLTLTEMRTVMLAFCRLLGPGIYAVIYYAGHGYELDGENYLLPVDAMSADPNEGIRAQEFLQEMQNCDTLLNLMFLDCCRTRAKDNKTPRCSLKRRTEGNTIIAYSCCTQHQAFEEPNEKNGVYARHLLKHLKRNVRIETILMDVSTAVVASRSVNQRPSYESDAYLECRLTAPIIPEPDGTKKKERYDLWYEGNRLLEDMTTDIGDGRLNLKFMKCFSNLLQIDLHITNNGHRPMNFVKFHVALALPVTEDVLVNNMIIPPTNQSTYFGSIRISKLQKLCNEGIFLVLEFETADERFIKKFDLGKPLISGITSSFHEWIKERKYDTESGAKSSWI